MRILALDTSTEACSVALLHDKYIANRFEIIPQQHSQCILPMLAELLASEHTQLKDCSAIAFGEGPGSFTGLRIAAGVAQGLALGLALPLIPISSLAALALAAWQQFPQQKYFVPLLDARMHEVYFALYHIDGDTITALIADSLASPQQANQQLKQFDLLHNWVGAGTAFTLYQTDIMQDIAPATIILDKLYPNATQIAELAKRAYLQQQTVSVANALPKYLRNQVTTKKL